MLLREKLLNGKRKMTNWLDVAEQLVIPVLKWVRGEPLSQDNWVELFCMIGLPKSMTLEKLTFGDLIAHSDAIINSADALKVRQFYAYVSWLFYLLRIVLFLC